MTYRKERLAEFLSPKGDGVIASMSASLVTAASAALQRSLEDRRRPSYRTATNHPSDHSLAAILLVVTAFDVWMNEGISQLSMRDKHLAPMAPNMGSCEKYGELAKVVKSTYSDPLRAELRLLVDVRDEIVHHLPRPLRLPPRLEVLEKRKLLLTTGDENSDFAFADKLAAYALGYWACETVNGALETLFSGAGDPLFELQRPTADNFGFFRGAISPTALDAFDREHALVLTA